MSKKIDPRDYVVTDTAVRSIDLDREEFTLRDGRRLSEDLAERLASQARAGSAGAISSPAANHCPVEGSTPRRSMCVSLSSCTKELNSGRPRRV